MAAAPETTTAATFERDSMGDSIESIESQDDSFNEISEIEQGVDDASDFFGDVEEGVSEFEDFFDEIDEGLSEIEEFLDGTIGEITDTIGKVWGLFNRVVSPIQEIFSDVQEMAGTIVRLINFPSTVSGWWESLLDSVTGEYDRCFSEFNPEDILEPGWCFGGTADSDIDSNSDGASDGDDSGDPTLPPFPPAPRKSTGEILKESAGPAGIPIPSTLAAKTSEAMADVGSDNIFETNSTVSIHNKRMANERAMTRVNVETILGENGQKKLIEELKATQDLVTASMGTAKAAQGLDVTQDVMKQDVQLTANANLLLGSLVVSSQQQRVDNAMTHLNLTNISRSTQQLTRGRGIDRTLNTGKVFLLTRRMSLN